jgi:fumarylacetoacetate (FAA) hydrolase
VKLASLRDGGRDGTLVVVSFDNAKAVTAPDVAPTLQSALDRWREVEIPLKDIFHALNQGKLDDRAIGFEPAQCAAPLPRAYQWADGSAYVHHMELVRKARGAEMPTEFWTDPLMYQGGSDRLLGPCDPIELIDENWGCDFEAEIAVITDDVPMGTKADDTASHIKLVLIANDVSLRNLIPSELGKGFGFFQSKPATAFSPVAVSPDSLGDGWDGGRLHHRLATYLNCTLFGQPDAGVDMTFDFPRLIAHAARTRHLGAGTIIGSGTVSNRDRSTGSSCLAERRMLEILDRGEARTPFLRWGDRVRIEMIDNHGNNLFGAIDQEVVRYRPG